MYFVCSGKNGNCNCIVIQYLLGVHEQFLDKVLEVIPAGGTPVFIADGAWNWIEDYYPHSTQILDFYHCKEHLCAFAKLYFVEKEAMMRVE